MHKWLLFVVLAVPALAQVNPGVVIVGVAPSGSCPQGVPGQLVNSTGNIYTCQNISGSPPTGTWTQATSSSAGCTVGGIAGDLQDNNGASGCGAAALNDNGTTITATENLTPKVAAAQNLGTSLLPFGDIYIGGSASKALDFNVSALSANRTMTIPDAASNPVQGIANPSDSNVINYIDTSGVQHRISQSGSALWSGIGNPTGNLSLSMGTNISRFTYSSALSDAFEWYNSTAATSGNNTYSPQLYLCGNYWNGSASAKDCIYLQNATQAGVGVGGLSVIHTGASSYAGAAGLFLDPSFNVLQGYGQLSFGLSPVAGYVGGQAFIAFLQGTTVAPALGVSIFSSYTAGTAWSGSSAGWYQSNSSAQYSALMGYCGIISGAACSGAAPTAGDIPIFHGTTGFLYKDSGININNSGLLTANGGITVPSGETLTIASGATLTCAGGSTCPSGGSTTIGSINTANACLDSSLVANTITCNTSGTYTSYTTGDVVTVKVRNATTGATTLSVNSIGAVNVVDTSQGAMTTNSLAAQGIYLCRYNSVGPVFECIPPSTGTGANTALSNLASVAPNLAIPDASCVAGSFNGGTSNATFNLTTSNCGVYTLTAISPTHIVLSPPAQERGYIKLIMPGSGSYSIDWAGTTIATGFSGPPACDTAGTIEYIDYDYDGSAFKLNGSCGLNYTQNALVNGIGVSTPASGVHGYFSADALGHCSKDTSGLYHCEPLTSIGGIVQPGGIATTVIAQKFFGTAAPGSVATNLPGDTFNDTTNNKAYICNKPSGTAAPACTAVAAGNWMEIDQGSGGTVTSSGTPTAHQTPVWTTATNLIGVGPGTTGQCWTSNGASADPSFQTCGVGAGVTSFSGDGGLLNNVLSTGAVTATLANAGAHKYWGNNTGSTAAPGYDSIASGDLPAQYTSGHCTEVWGGSGTSFALTSGDDAVSDNTCYNPSTANGGVTRTITSVSCLSDNASNTTTINPVMGASGTGTTILSGAMTCGSSNAMSTMGVLTIANATWAVGTGINPVMGGVLTGTHIAMQVNYTY